MEKVDIQNGFSCLCPRWEDRESNKTGENQNENLSLQVPKEHLL